MKHRVLISIPTHDAKISVPTCQSLIHGIAVASRDHAINISFTSGNSIIARARCLMLAEFMAKVQYDTLFMIDADIGFQPDALKRLIELPEEVVAGVYPYRSDDRAGKFPVRWEAQGDVLVTNESGLIEARGVPGGFLRIKRTAIDKLIAAHPERLVYDPEAEGGSYYALFSNEAINGGFMGEDFYFCNLWRNIGGKVWVDPNISFEHMGVKSWRGNLGQTLIPKTAEDLQTSDQSTAA